MTETQVPFKTVQIPYNITLETARNLLVSAFEGGSNYWMYIYCYSYPYGTTRQDFETGKFAVKDEVCGDFWPIAYVLPFVKGGGVCLMDKNEEVCSERRNNPDPNVNVTYTLTREKLLNGFDVMARKYPHHFQNIVNENDDAETADVLLQCALFGEIIYG